MTSTSMSKSLGGSALPNSAFTSLRATPPYEEILRSYSDHYYYYDDDDDDD